MGPAGGKRPCREVTAMVIGAVPMGEYDRRLVLLTRECGKISAFAKGARRPNSPLLAASDLFAFGSFRLYMGRDSYTLTEASVQNYFAYFRTHAEASFLAQYFCEVLEYCTRENNDEAQLLLLLYQTLRALESERFPARLVRAVFELKTVAIEGELRDPAPNSLQPATAAAFRHIASQPVAKLYTFTLEREAEKELAELADKSMRFAFERHRFRSLDIVELLQADDENPTTQELRRI